MHLCSPGYSLVGRNTGRPEPEGVALLARPVPDVDPLLLDEPLTGFSCAEVRVSVRGLSWALDGVVCRRDPPVACVLTVLLLVLVAWEVPALRDSFCSLPGVVAT